MFRWNWIELIVRIGWMTHVCKSDFVRNEYAIFYCDFRMKQWRDVSHSLPVFVHVSDLDNHEAKISYQIIPLFEATRSIYWMLLLLLSLFYGFTVCTSHYNKYLLRILFFVQYIYTYIFNISHWHFTFIMQKPIHTTQFCVYFQLEQKKTSWIKWKLNREKNYYLNTQNVFSYECNTFFFWN